MANFIRAYQDPDGDDEPEVTEFLVEESVVLSVVVRSDEGDFDTKDKAKEEGTDRLHEIVKNASDQFGGFDYDWSYDARVGWRAKGDHGGFKDLR